MVPSMCAMLSVLLSGCGVASLKVGFVGDTSAGDAAANVYKIMRDQGVDVVVQNGDYDYSNQPDVWDAFLEKEWYGMGREHALMTSGNHDTTMWGGSSGYQARLYNKLSSNLLAGCRGRAGEPLSTEYGRWMSCKLEDVHFVMFGWREMEGSMSDVSDFVRQEFESSTARWRVCVWHRPEGSLNPGHRHTSTWGQWEAYEACREHGALVVTGHSHCYGRTKLMTNFEAKAVSSLSQRDRVELDCGASASIVSGMGGEGPDDLGPYGSMDYIQKTYTSQDGRDHGALVCDFPLSGEGKCELYVGTAPGSRFDTFALTTGCQPEPVPVPGEGEISVSVSDNTDDVEEDVASGALSTRSSDLELLYDGAAQVVGVRWTGVRIPLGSTILDARVEFQCHEASQGSDGPRMSVAFDKTSDSDAWDTSRTPSQRTLTSAVEWDVNGQAWAAGEHYQTPNLAAALQEVVDIFDWSSGNAVSVVLTQVGSTTSKRTAVAHDADGRGPTLIVRYAEGDATVPLPTDPVPVPVPVEGTVELRARVNSRDDDVEQQSSTTLSTGSSDLELAYDTADQTVGIRFRDLQIPQGAEVVSAYIEFTAAETGSGTSPQLVIHGDDADSSAAFSTDASPYTRQETSAEVQWDNLGDWATGSTYRTPDLSPIISEITGRSGWTPSSALSLLVKSRTGGQEKRVAESYNGDANAAPLLVVSYRG